MVPAQWGPAVPEGGASPSFLPPTDAQEPTGAAAITLCQTLATSSHCHCPDPGARPRLDPVRSRILSPSAAGKITERQTGSFTRQSGQHAQAIQQLSLVIPSSARGLCPASASHELPASPSSWRGPPRRLLWPEPPLPCEFLPALFGGHSPPETGSERPSAQGPRELRLEPRLAWWQPDPST